VLVTRTTAASPSKRGALVCLVVGVWVLGFGGCGVWCGLVFSVWVLGLGDVGGRKKGGGGGG
jgi:hypothetical protein